LLEHGVFFFDKSIKCTKLDRTYFCLFYSLIEGIQWLGWYQFLVYTKTVDSVIMHALIGYSNSEYPLLFTSEQLARAPENIVLSFHE